MASRYQQRALYAERGGVSTFEGLDPLTGLPVLIYRFKGQAPRALSELESENIPGVLEVSSENGESRVVAAYSREYRPLVHPLHVSPAVLLLDSARALKDAAQAGVRHGDLRPVRFLASRDHVLVEGFGIPWPSEPSPYRAPEPQASFAGDIYAWAKSMLDLCGEVLSPEVKALLGHCLKDEAPQRPEALDLYNQLSEALARSSDPMPASVSASAEGIEGEIYFEEDAADPDIPLVGESTPTFDFDVTLTPPPEERPASGDALDAWEADDDPMLIASDPGMRPRERSSPTGDERGFVRQLPPDATYRAGDPEANPYLRPGAFEEYTFDGGEEGSRRKRRFLLLLLLFALALALGSLAFWRQRQTLPGGATPTGSYIVNVSVEPSGLPPVTLFVVSSPEGSRLQPGEGLQEVSPEQPGQVVLDHSGVWRLQGRLEDRASEVVTLEVPEERAITIVMPEP